MSNIYLNSNFDCPTSSAILLIFFSKAAAESSTSSRKILLVLLRGGALSLVAEVDPVTSLTSSLMLLVIMEFEEIRQVRAS